ncbi:hypothetical protein LYSHEL_26500 [Lysobacter helvus]|uniref:Uncharacterized protein n=2 Tax=Lysobacteraceae TaxID=32033 RepID=A0ABN6FW91_9GAMM|nr:MULTISPECIES: hypothetical protein [Lysobacter]BCT93625.1 hypothetical protein LYSCAS_26490 [Lysobacter caseinilyticus]BCT96779.1 hypothetical protein LYSHEL_26500 [Lysobacter helvus]
MAFARVVAVLALVCAVLSVALRARVINVLKAAGLHEHFGSPRTLSHGDFLHYRVVGISWKQPITPHKLLFRSFVAFAILLDLCCVVIGLWLAFGRR